MLEAVGHHAPYGHDFTFVVGGRRLKLRLSEYERGTLPGDDSREYNIGSLFWKFSLLWSYTQC